jgi:hypothetical protein
VRKTLLFGGPFCAKPPSFYRDRLETNIGDNEGRGVLSHAGVIANGKHYLLNNQEDNRWFGSNDADIRTIMEMYLPPFEGAVKAGIGSLMCRYGKRPFFEATLC